MSNSVSGEVGILQTLNSIRRDENDILKGFYQRYGEEIPYTSHRGVRVRTKSFELWLAEENRLLRDELKAVKKQLSAALGMENL